MVILRLEILVHLLKECSVLAGVDYIEVPTFKIYNFHICNFLGPIFASHLKKKNFFNAEILVILNAVGRNSMTQLTLKCSANKKNLEAECRLGN